MTQRIQQINFRLSSASIHKLNSIFRWIRSSETFDFLDTKFVSKSLTSSPTTFIRSIVEASIDLLALDCEHENLINEIYNLFQDSKNLQQIRTHLKRDKSLSNVLIDHLIVIAYKRHELSRSENDIEFQDKNRIKRVCDLYNVNQKDISKTIMRLSKS